MSKLQPWDTDPLVQGELRPASESAARIPRAAGMSCSIRVGDAQAARLRSAPTSVGGHCDSKVFSYEDEHERKEVVRKKSQSLPLASNSLGIAYGGIHRHKITTP